MSKFMVAAKTKLLTLAIKTKSLYEDQRGEAFVELMVRILLIIVLGSLLLTGLYALIGDIVLPLLKERIQSMFNFAG